MLTTISSKRNYSMVVGRMGYLAKQGRCMSHSNFPTVQHPQNVKLSLPGRSSLLGQRISKAVGSPVNCGKDSTVGQTFFPNRSH